ncbi:MAG: sugar phosphate nucleotidyltransferase, partial [Clostridia bacterium]|nr:sugar phosphate nucleotidyltransferase [Clostridia bacterium]
TQYHHLELHDYIGRGEPWDLDRQWGGVHILPPYHGENGGEWYKGTANAIYQNLHFINRYGPQRVLVLSGDHIYKMDYRPMIQQHIETGAACTIACREVPLAEASRFGIITSEENGVIREFEEKPEKPKGTKASMGVYVFDTDILTRYLKADELDGGSAHDFGQNIIPNMLRNREHMMAYTFEGYWKDVGTVGSLWQANMDLLDDRAAINLYDDSWPVAFRHQPTYPQFIAREAVVQNALVAEGCEIAGTVVDSVLFPNVRVGPGAIVRDCVLMEGTQVGENARMEYVIADAGAKVGAGVIVGAARGDGVYKASFGAPLLPFSPSPSAGEATSKTESARGAPEGGGGFDAACQDEGPTVLS